MIIPPEELKVGDVFEEPISEEEHHGLVKKESREEFEVLQLQHQGPKIAIYTFALTRRKSDGRIVEVHLVPWVRLSVKRTTAESPTDATKT